MTEGDIRDYIRTEMSQHCACGGVASDPQPRPGVRSRPAPELQLNSKVEDGRELRMVVNTNDPDYEHIYSIEAYDEPAENTPLLAAQYNQSDGEAEPIIQEKKITVEPNKSARTVPVNTARAAVVLKAGRVNVQRAVKGTPGKAVAPKSVRPKRGVSGEAPAPAEPCLLPMDEGGCGHYSLRWYFSVRASACRPFIYSGCEGNDNRFLELEECEETCLGRPQLHTDEHLVKKE